MNLGLSEKTMREYGKMPSLGDMATPYKDKNGFYSYDEFGNVKYLPSPGVSVE